MKGFQKGLAGLLGVLMLTVPLAACNRGGTKSAASGTSGTAAKSSSKEVDMIVSTFNNPFFVSVKNGAEYEAKKLGYNLVVQNANNDSSTELNLAQTDIAKKPAALILDPVDSDAIVSAINQANSANVPVYAFDRLPAGGKILTFVGFDSVAAGKEAADALAKGIGNKGTVVEIQGTMGTNVAQDRSKGFEEEMAAKYPNIKIVSKQPANFDRTTALNTMTNVLQAHSNINGVYAANDEMAMGVLAALKARGLDKKVVLVGNDGISDALKAVESGEMYATHAESPFYEGIRVADIAGNIIAGKSVPGQTTLSGQLVYNSNVPAYRKYLKSIGDTSD